MIIIYYFAILLFFLLIHFWSNKCHLVSRRYYFQKQKKKKNSYQPQTFKQYYAYGNQGNTNTFRTLYLVWRVVVERWGVLGLSAAGVLIWGRSGVVIRRDPLHSARHLLCHILFIIIIITWEGGHSETMIPLAIPAAISEVKICQKNKPAEQHTVVKK